MADNVIVDNVALADYTVATDDDGTAQHQYVKLEYGADGTFTKVASGANALPVQGTVAVSGATVTAAVLPPGAANIATAQAAPTTTAANIVAVRATRTRLILVNHGTVDVYVGPATVTTANGLKISPGASLAVVVTSAVQGITASGTGAIHSLEEYA